MAERRQDRNGKGRLRTEEPVADKSGGAGGERHGEKGAHAHFRHHQLDREHDAADRRVEGRRDAGAGAGADQRDALPGIEPQNLTDARSERGANLDDRSFAADRRAGADGKRRRDRFDDGDDRPDDALFVVDGVHDLGDAVTAGFRGEIRDQRGDHHAADDRRQDDERTPRAGRRKYIGVVVDGKSSEEKQVMNCGNQAAKEYSAEPGDEPGDQRET